MDKKEKVARELVKIAREMVGIVFPRESYLPKDVDYETVTPDGTDMVAYKWQDSRGKWVGIAFQGRAKKPLFYYTFNNEARVDKTINDYAESRRSQLESKAKRKKERQEYKHDYQEGDFLVASWGYDQTNIDFYQVTEVGEKSIVIREVAKKVVKESRGADYVVPVKNKFTDKKMKKRVSPGGNVKIDSVSRAYKWDGKPKYETAAGWGH